MSTNNINNYLKNIAESDGGKNKYAIDTPEGEAKLKKLTAKYKDTEHAPYLRHLVNTYEREGSVFVNNSSDNNYNYGNGNINVSGDLIIIKNNSTKTTPTVQEQEENPVETENKNNVAQAKEDGKQVAEDLKGYTKKAEKERALETINKQSENTIIGFIVGYNSEKNIATDYILKQVKAEYGWTDAERKEVYQKIISSVLSFAEKANLKDEYAEEFAILNKALKQAEIDSTKLDAKKADKAINQIVTGAQAKFNIY